MLIPPDEAQLFHRLYPSFIGFVAGQLGGVAGIRDANTFRTSSNEAMAEARDRMLDNIALIDDFVEVNPDRFSERELSHVSLWRHFVRGRFVVERDLRNYTVILDDGRPARAYAVLGLTTEIVEMLPIPMPALVEAVLLPWKGRVVCDGLIGSFNISMGGGIRRAYRETYREAKARGIIMSLNPDWQPPPEKPARKPKTPAIARFPKKCPKTVAEFQLKHGEPRMDMAHAAAREYSVWSVDEIQPSTLTTSCCTPTSSAIKFSMCTPRMGALATSQWSIPQTGGSTTSGLTWATACCGEHVGTTNAALPFSPGTPGCGHVQFTIPSGVTTARRTIEETAVRQSRRHASQSSRRGSAS